MKHSKVVYFLFSVRIKSTAAEAPLVGVVGHALRVRAALRKKEGGKMKKKNFQKKNFLNTNLGTRGY